MGGRIYKVGAAIDTRHRLTKDDDVETAVGLGVRVAGVDDVKFVSSGFYEIGVEPDFRLGLDISRKSQLAFGLTPAVVYSDDSRSSTYGPIPRSGLSLSPRLTIAVDVGISDGFHIVPEVSATTFVGSDSFRIDDDTVFWRAALGFYF